MGQSGSNLPYRQLYMNFYRQLYINTFPVKNVSHTWQEETSVAKDVSGTALLLITIPPGQIAAGVWA